MSEKTEITGKFKFDQDSKRFHRFQIETDVGIVGTVYIPKDMGFLMAISVIAYEQAHP